MKKLVFAFFALLGFALLVWKGPELFKLAQPKGPAKAVATSSASPTGMPVQTQVAKTVQWQPYLQGIGSVAAINGVSISPQLAGTVVQIAFDSGTRVKANDLLVQFDISQEQAQLALATAKRDLARLTLDRDRNLLATRTISQSELDTAEANFRQTQGSVEEAQAIIEKKTIRAPFDGVAGIRQINLGQYVNPGQALVTLQAFNPVYVNFMLPQENLGDIAIGGKVEVLVDVFPQEVFAGQVTAINSEVDQTTRYIQVQATVPNQDHRLRPGMYAKVNLITGTERTVVAIPDSAVNYAPYGNSVFIVSDMTGTDGKAFKGVKQQFVRLGQTRGEMISVTSGVKPGDEVVTTDVFRLRNGAAVSTGASSSPESRGEPATPSNS
jgi:membrane fusion protein (multidrug efflux system)